MTTTQEKQSRVPVPEIDQALLSTLYTRVEDLYEEAKKALTQLRAAITSARRYPRDEKKAARVATCQGSYDKIENELRTAIRWYTATYNAAVDLLPPARLAFMKQVFPETLGMYLDIRRPLPSVPKPYRLFAALYWMPEEDEATPLAYLVFWVQLRPQGRKFTHLVGSLLTSDVLKTDSGQAMIQEKAVNARIVAQGIMDYYRADWPQVQVTFEVHQADQSLTLIYG